MKGLSSSLWFELFFKPHLSIESGVSLARTCSFFWKSEKIQNWIREKEKQVFGFNISKSAWNKLTDYADLPVGGIRFVFENYLVLYTRPISHFVGRNASCIYSFGVFSSKERLFLALKTLLNLESEGTSNLYCKPEKNFFIVKKQYICLYVSHAIWKDFEHLLISH